MQLAVRGGCGWYEVPKFLNLHSLPLPVAAPNCKPLNPAQLVPTSWPAGLMSAQLSLGSVKSQRARWQLAGQDNLLPGHKEP